MGIYDRDYYREDDRWSNPFARAKGTVFLCLCYVVIFIAQVGTLDARQQWANQQPTGLTAQLQLDVEKVLRGEVWRVFTYAFVHHPSFPFQAVITIIFLAWIGHHVEDIYGVKEYLSYFFAASLFGGMAYTLVAVLGPGVPPLLGPSGAISAILILYALHYPTRTINVFFFIPVPIWIIVGLYAVHDVAGLAGHGANTSVVAVHIIGAIIAFLHHTYTLRFSNLLPRWNRPTPRRQHNPRLRVYREQPQPEPAATASNAGPMSQPLDGPPVDEHLEAKLDEVLEKVSQHGQDSLTDAERDILKKASEIYKKRRQGP